MHLLRLLFLAVAVFGAVVLTQSDAHAQQAPIFAILYGANETSAGDDNGWGSFSMVFRNGPTAGMWTLCYGIAVVGIDTPNAAHIHRGAPGVSGDPEVTLVEPSSGNGGASSACVEVTAALGGEIRSFPARFYINVHTGNFGGGALRGQLF